MDPITQILLNACIATVLYALTFVVVFDRILAWAEGLPVQSAPSAEARTRTARKPLRGLAAEPTVLPRTLSGVDRPTDDAKDVMAGLIGRLDSVPSTGPAASAAAA